jgi:putative transposase
MVGIDVGLNHFYTDSDGNQVENPRFLHKSETTLKRLNRGLHRKKKGSKNRAKARNRLGRKHLKVSRQRKDFCVKAARKLCQSSDLVAFEDLRVQNLVKNRKLAKSISDASWSLFKQWVIYYGNLFGIATVAVAPHYTSVNCSKCGEKVEKTLSTRTHRCHNCGFVLDRDWNAALNILKLALSTVGHTGTSTPADENDLCVGEVTPQRKPTRRTRKSKP